MQVHQMKISHHEFNRCKSISIFDFELISQYEYKH